jgi:hypothetical protein
MSEHFNINYGIGFRVPSWPTAGNPIGDLRSLRKGSNNRGNDRCFIDRLVEPTLHFELGVNAKCLSLSCKSNLSIFEQPIGHADSPALFCRRPSQ